jgi:hypothetical protein
MRPTPLTPSLWMFCVFQLAVCDAEIGGQIPKWTFGNLIEIGRRTRSRRRKLLQGLREDKTIDRLPDSGLFGRLKPSFPGAFLRAFKNLFNGYRASACGNGHCNLQLMGPSKQDFREVAQRLARLDALEIWRRHLHIVICVVQIAICDSQTVYPGNNYG